MRSSARRFGDALSEHTCQACRCEIIIAAGAPLVVCGECLVHATMRREMVKPRVLEDGTREYGEVDHPTRIPSGRLVSSVRVKAREIHNHHSDHETVSVWTRGGLAGELIVTMGDGDEIARRLITTTLTELTEADSALGELRDLVELIATHDLDRDSMINIQRDCEMLAKRLGWLK